MPLVSRTFDQLIDFTRASSATYVDASGRIVPTAQSRNLLTYTQEFDNAAWTALGSTVTANSATAPDGTLTADTIVANGTNSIHGLRGTQSALAVTRTVSIYAKAGTASLLQILFDTDSAPYANFDLAAGTVGAVGGGTSSIQSVGNGWYRCVFVTSSTTATNLYFVISNSASAARYPAFVSSGTILLWGAQLEAASTATDYTRNVGGLFPPRFDYDPVTLAPKGLLVEEQRTNLLLRSEEFDNASWIKTRLSVTANTATSPDGTLDAEKLVEDTSTDTHILSIGPSASAAAHTLSVYLKAAERSWVRISIDQNVACSAFFDVANGTVGTLAGGATATITAVGNGWYRCTVTGTITATPAVWIALATGNGVTSYTGVAGNGLFIWGAQLEAGAFATSYIPTVASQVTRSADVATITGANFSQWYNQSEGTFVVEFDSTAGAVTVAMQAGIDSTTNNRISINSDTFNFAVADASGTTQATLSSTSLRTGAVAKVAGAYKANDFAVSVNGAAALTDTAGTVPAPNSLMLGGRNTASPNSQLCGHIRSIRYYPTRRSNADLQALTA